MIFCIVAIGSSFLIVGFMVKPIPYCSRPFMNEKIILLPSFVLFLLPCCLLIIDAHYFRIAIASLRDCLCFDNLLLCFDGLRHTRVGSYLG